MDPKGSNRFGRGPAITSHVATSVAPFQLAYRATLSSDLRSAARTGASVGRPLHGKRKALYDSQSGGKRAFRSNSPSWENSEKYGWLPQPTNTLPSDRSSALPWEVERSPSGEAYSLSSVALISSSSRCSRTARDTSCPARLAPLSKTLTVPSSWRLASCWRAVRVPSPISKSLLLPPRRHTISPVLRSIL